MPSLPPSLSFFFFFFFFFFFGFSRWLLGFVFVLLLGGWGGGGGAGGRGGGGGGGGGSRGIPRSRPPVSSRMPRPLRDPDCWLHPRLQSDRFHSHPRRNLPNSGDLRGGGQGTGWDSMISPPTSHPHDLWCPSSPSVPGHSCLSLCHPLASCWGLPGPSPHSGRSCP